MKCHKCNQDSIKVKGGVSEGRSCFFLHIQCDICGLDIEVTGDQCPHLGELFIYNESLEAAYRLGEESYFEVDKTNPYSLNADQIALNRSWREGWNDEKRSAEFEALSFSSEKIKEELEDVKKQRDKEYKKKRRYSTAYKELLLTLTHLSKSSYWLKRTYKDCINRILEVAERKNPDK